MRVNTLLASALVGLFTSVASLPDAAFAFNLPYANLFVPKPVGDSSGSDGLPGHSPVTAHPAVARIIVPERGATAFGSGTLVDVRDQYGLVVTNWHVVRDATRAVTVTFPSGFRSLARPLKVDSDWDLAALVIWRPPMEPVKLAKRPPRPGDLLTIHGYGRGQYRIATGRCTSYYAPRLNYPMELVELNVEARQGDSGGPMFNQQGELAGVLFGAGEGTTLGSFGPRVGSFLATLAPDIGQAHEQEQVAVADRPAPNVWPAPSQAAKPASDGIAARAGWPSSPWLPAKKAKSTEPAPSLVAKRTRPSPSASYENDGRAESTTHSTGWYEPLKTLLAMIGLVAIAMKLVKAVR